MTEMKQRDINKILKQRAIELSEVTAGEAVDHDTIEIVEFVLSYEKYGIESRYVDEVYPMKDYTSVPGTPPFVLGIINLRGTILSVIDIRKFFDLPVKGLSNLNRVIVVRTPMMELGIISDFILGVRRIPKRTIQSSLPTLTGIRAKYLHGLTEEGLVILDVDKIVTDPEIVVNDEIDA
jgi:purine-binding chemotaxis protein CheW